MNFFNQFTNKITATAAYALEMGPEWAFFRLRYEAEKKLGRFTRSNQKTTALRKSWEVSGKTISSHELEIFSFSKIRWKPSEIEKAITVSKNGIQGRLRYFSHLNVDLAPLGQLEWNLNPLTGGRAPVDQPWNEIPDFGAFGDIKGIWEGSRFPHTYSVVIAYQNDPIRHEALARAWLSQMENWIDLNPFPFGPHYKCGQEISLRILNMAIGVAAFRTLASATFIRKFSIYTVTSGSRISANLDYATQSVRNNHSISEAMGLIVTSLLLRDVDKKLSKQWLSLGIKTLNDELEYQVFEDGSYIQHSHNYARLALDVISTTLCLLERSKIELAEFSPELEKIKYAHQRLLVFLVSMEVADGHLPNYGANDGAYLFPLPSSVYPDFRESLEFASRICNRQSLYTDYGHLAEIWGLPNEGKSSIAKLDQFPNGGYFVLRSENIVIHLRSHSYKTRPSHCDPHHVDVWVGSENIFCDSGSYSYNTEPSLIAKFTGSLGHNTCMIDREEPMIRVGHFGWRNWIQSNLLETSKNRIVVQHTGYKKSKGILLEREVRLDGRKLTIVDRGIGVRGKVQAIQTWNTECDENKLKAIQLKSTASQKIFESEVSKYYAQKTPSWRVEFQLTTNSDFEIRTEMEI